MFSDRIITEIQSKKTCLCLGLDPVFEKFPHELLKKFKDLSQVQNNTRCDLILEFCTNLIDACIDHVVCIKPQIAFFEMLGSEGFNTFQKVVKYAQSQGLIVIADAKRNDISSTASAYAKAFFGDFINADGVTVNPYLGSDGIVPFTDYKEKGVFVLLKTSNPSSKEIQMLPVNGNPLYIAVAELIHTWGAVNLGKLGYSNVGAVVGATFPEEAKIIRKKMPKTLFLVPGVGTQGGKFEDLACFFNKDKLGVIVNSSREINYAFNKTGLDYKTSAHITAKEIKEKINRAISI